MRKIIFDAQAEIDEEDVELIEVPWPGVKEPFHMISPTPAQITVVMSAGANASGLLRIIERNGVEPEFYEAVVAYLDNPRVVDAEITLVNFFADIVEELVGTPTKSSSGSSRSSATGGRSSTGSTPRPASTRSSSRPRGTSTSSGRGSSGR